MDLQKIAIKFFAEKPEWSRPVEPAELIPVFHRWIQERRIPGTLIDVADYSHLSPGPGVGLVGFEADVFFDSMEGPPGLLYTRKTPVAGGLEERLRLVFRAALEACEKLEAEPELTGRLRFRRDEALFISNDRLIGPNDLEPFPKLVIPLEKVANTVLPGAAWRLRGRPGDPRRRLAIHLERAV
jgi:hypothetical protein